MTKMLVYLVALVISCDLAHSRSLLTEEEADTPILYLSKLKNSVFGRPSKEVGEILESNSNLKGNPEEYGPYFEGDILHPTPNSRNGLLNETFRWKEGIVPLEIRGTFTPKELNTISRAIEIYHNTTCIRFVQRLRENDYVIITNFLRGCFSSIGRIRGPQLLNLQAPCLRKIGTTLHELMHAIGFLHEHVREDRDEYVNIKWDNIINETRRNFVKAENGTTTSYNNKYDYGSVLHYSAYAFAINKSEVTIEKLRTTSDIMGQRDHFAKSDLNRIRSMYKCKGTTNGSGKDRPRKPVPLEVMDVISSIFGSDTEEE